MEEKRCGNKENSGKMNEFSIPLDNKEGTPRVDSLSQPAMKIK